MAVGSGRFVPSGLIPPSTYPVARSASAASAIAQRRPPSASATAFRSTSASAGTTASPSCPSTETTIVLNTRPASRPSAATASSAYPRPPSRNDDRGSCAYSCTAYTIPARRAISIARVP